MAIEKKSKKLILALGLSGAGRSTLINVLEDQGFYVIDNLPAPLIKQNIKFLLSQGNSSIAIGIDNYSFDFSQFQQIITTLKKENDSINIKIIFLTCDDNTLIRRFKETRRLHPFTDQKLSLQESIEQQKIKTKQLLNFADIVIDTTSLDIRTFKELLLSQLNELIDSNRFLITVMSFGFKYGIPPIVDIVFDVRFINNPFYIPKLKQLTGKDSAVAQHIMSDESFSPFFSNLKEFFKITLPKYEVEGKTYLTVAFGCTGGKHRSVFCAQLLAKHLKQKNYNVLLFHRDINKKKI